jgi:hypothetical protein
MYRFINHRCQEKNDVRVKKRSTPFRRGIPLEEKMRDKFRARAEFFAGAHRVGELRAPLFARCGGAFAPAFRAPRSGSFSTR